MEIRNIAKWLSIFVTTTLLFSNFAFADVSLNGEVGAMDMDDAGNLHVVGTFHNAGGNAVLNGYAVLDAVTRQWRAPLDMLDVPPEVPNSLNNNSVYHKILAVSDSQVYIQTSTKFYKWNGSTWKTIMSWGSHGSIGNIVLLGNGDVAFNKFGNIFRIPNACEEWNCVVDMNLFNAKFITTDEYGVLYASPFSSRSHNIGGLTNSSANTGRSSRIARWNPGPFIGSWTQVRLATGSSMDIGSPSYFGFDNNRNIISRSASTLYQYQFVDAASYQTWSLTKPPSEQSMFSERYFQLDGKSFGVFDSREIFNLGASLYELVNTDWVEVIGFGSVDPDVDSVFPLNDTGVFIVFGDFAGHARIVDVANVMAQDDSYSADQSQVVSVPAPGVLANDDGFGLQVNLITQPTYGIVSLYADGSFLYTPNENYIGQDSFTYQAFNDLGVYSNAATVSFTVSPDSAIPVGTIISPQVGETVDGNHMISGTVSDAGGSGLSLVNIAIRDLQTYEWLDASGNGTVNWQVLSASLTNQTLNSADWSASIDFPAGLTGNFRIHVVPKDNAGNSSSSTFHNFTVSSSDSEAPTSTIISPGPSESIAGTHVVSGTSIDFGGSGLREVNIAIRSLQTFEWLDTNGNSTAGWQVIPATLLNQTNNSADWEASINFPANLKGNFRVHVVPIDNAGNSSSSSFQNFTVSDSDVITPAGIIVLPQANEAVNGVQVISGSATDAGGSGLLLVNLAIRNLQTFEWVDANGNSTAGWQTISTTLTNQTTDAADWTASINFPSSLTGNFRVHVVPKDNAGNSSSSTFINFAITNTDDETPTGVISSPESSEVVNGGHVISGSAADTGGSGLSSVNIAIRDLQSYEWLDAYGNSTIGWQVISSSLVNQTGDSADWSATIAFPANITGNFRIHVVPKDNAGNSSSATYTNFTVE